MINSTWKFGTLALMTGAAICLSAPSADAVLTLMLDDPSTVGTDVVVVDGDGDGAVVFAGSFGDWTLNVSTGISKPIVGTDAAPKMDLNSINVSSGPGSLIFTLIDSFATAPAGMIESNIGGTLNSGGASISAVTSTDIGGLTGAGHLHSGSGAFSSTSAGVVPAAPFDLIMSATLTHETAGNSSFDWEVRSVPDGGTSVLLLGLSMLGLVGVRRKLA